MIISRTPVRMSFAGGGSDLREYYKHRPGSVLSTTINKYLYIMINQRFTDKIRIAYSKVEEAENVDQIEHNLVREAMKIVGWTKGMEVAYVSDLLAAHEGSGLGASSAITVGTLHALHAFKGEHVSAKQLADEACQIEIEILGHPIGKQDQYAAAFGGLNFIQFNPDESVDVEKVIMKKETKQQLQRNLIAFHTGMYTRSDTTLTEQRSKTKENLEVLDKMVELSKKLKIALESNNLAEFGNILHENWVFKQKLASNITNPKINDYYERARKAGVIGGKILGSGGGGFLLFYCEENKQPAVRKALSELREFKFNFENEGSRIIYVNDLS